MINGIRLLIFAPNFDQMITEPHKKSWAFKRFVRTLSGSRRCSYMNFGENPPQEHIV